MDANDLAEFGGLPIRAQFRLQTLEKQRIPLNDQAQPIRIHLNRSAFQGILRQTVKRDDSTRSTLEGIS